MNNRDSSRCQSVDELLSGYLDGELTQQERQRVEVHMDGCQRCSARLRELGKLRMSVGKLQLDGIAKEEWEEMMNDAVARTARGAGWLLFVGGVLALAGYIGNEFVLSRAEPPLIKWAVGALYLGLAALLLSVLRQRLVARRKDKYKDVEI